MSASLDLPTREVRIWRIRLAVAVSSALLVAGMLGVALPLSIDAGSEVSYDHDWFDLGLLGANLVAPTGLGGMLYCFVRLWRLAALQFKLRTLLIAASMIAVLLALTLGDVRHLHAAVHWPETFLPVIRVLRDSAPQANLYGLGQNCVLIQPWFLLCAVAFGRAVTAYYVNWPKRAGQSDAAIACQLAAAQSPGKAGG